MSNNTGKGGNLTWVKGDRELDKLDDTSQRILRGGAANERL